MWFHSSLPFANIRSIATSAWLRVGVTFAAPTTTEAHIHSRNSTAVTIARRFMSSLGPSEESSSKATPARRPIKPRNRKFPRDSPDKPLVNAVCGGYKSFLRDIEKTSENSNNNGACEEKEISLDSLEKYISEPCRTLEEILSLDVRTLPAEVRLSCLESVLEINRESKVGAAKSHTPDIHINSWSQKYLRTEHSARWQSWNLGINPFDSGSSVPFTSSFVQPRPKWLCDPRFKLLVLTTAASANKLPLPRLLNLAGHMRYLWGYFDPMVFASVLRLVTTQVNEVSPVELLRLVSLTRGLPTSRESPSPNGAQENLESYQKLQEEVHLLRMAAKVHILSKLHMLESFGAVTLMNVFDELYPVTDEDERKRILEAVGNSLVISPEQQNLYTLVFLCTRLSRHGVYQRFILNKCMGQIQRKLNLAYRFPGTDQGQWFITLVAALANLHVGAPQLTEQTADDIEGFSQLPLMPQEKTIFPSPHVGVDTRNCFFSDWIVQTFTDLAGYISRSSPNPSLRLEMAYLLALLGYRASSLIEKAYHSPTEQSSSGKVPLLEMIELLVGPPTHDAHKEINLQTVGWLPRVDWQFYYRLASEAAANTSPSKTGSDKQLVDYISSKTTQVEEIVEILRSRLTRSSTLKLLPFHRCQLEPGGISYFADIVLAKESLQSAGYTKIVLCFVCEKRDLLANRPLEALRSAYNDDRIDFLIFDYSGYSQSEYGGKRDRSDDFLREMGRAMMERQGARTSELRVWSERVQ
ncbi:unnamed protein product [Calicophoron daubneyi]|uniref:Uncharacterized protein n=1 Tax=Calicophoron daubneyi TaxID=300641 RepID=A0AAV2T2N1_CALDB